MPNWSDYFPVLKTIQGGIDRVAGNTSTDEDTPTKKKKVKYPVGSGPGTDDSLTTRMSKFKSYFKSNRDINLPRER